MEVLSMHDRYSVLEQKVQLKATKWKTKEKEGETVRQVAQVLVVAKWGGELTVKGLEQAEDLGRRLRSDLYPNDPTFGLLRLHATFQHDFKIYSSQEGRCQVTAAAFTKGFLDLEGDLTPILVSLVTRDAFAQGLLDEPIPKKQRDAVKAKIEQLLLSDVDLCSPEILEQACPTDHSGLREAARRIGSPLQLLHKLKNHAMKYVDSIVFSIAQLTDEMRGSSPCDEEDETISYQTIALSRKTAALTQPPVSGAVSGVRSPLVIPSDLKDVKKRHWMYLRRKHNRWRKLLAGIVQLKDPDGGYDNDNVSYDVSKIPDLWDNLYYDMVTHRSILGDNSCAIAEAMVALLHPLAQWVCLSEYGIDQDEKLRIGTDVTWRLVGKILADLEFMFDEDLDEAGKPKQCLEEPVTPCGSGRDEPGDSCSQTPTHTTSAFAPLEHAEPDDGWRGISQGRDTSQHKPAARPSAPFEEPRSAGDFPAEAASDVSPSKVPAALPIDSLSSRVSLSKDPRRAQRMRLTPQLRKELAHALRDSSDWHPRLNEEVARLTGISTSHKVRSRIYCTSASTMHSLLNILRHGHTASGTGSIISDLGHINDLNYLTQIVFRCYERDAGEDEVHQGERSTRHHGRKTRHRVEILLSSGVQVLRDGQVGQWPEGSELCQERCDVAPLQVVADCVDLEKLEHFLNDVVKEFGHTAGDSSDGPPSEQDD